MREKNSIVKFLATLDEHDPNYAYIKALNRVDKSIKAELRQLNRFHEATKRMAKLAYKASKQNLKFSPPAKPNKYEAYVLEKAKTFAFQSRISQLSGPSFKSGILSEERYQMWSIHD